MELRFNAIVAGMILAGCICTLQANNVFAQASMTAGGNWETASNWSGNNIGDQVTEDVTMGNGLNPKINTGSHYKIGNWTIGNNTVITISSGSSLDVGDATHTRSMTTNNNVNFSVSGTLTIWGDLNINQNLVWSIPGTVIIKGNVILGGNVNLSVTGGNLQINGNFDSGNNNVVSVPSGSITVGGDIDIGNSSTLSGCSGCFHVGGDCDGPNSFCNSGVLPITLGSFDAVQTGNRVDLNWTTLTEMNFEKFVIEHADNGPHFEEIGSVQGNGNSTTPINYLFTDELPVIGKNYYRLRSVDFDASFSYSKVLMVNLTSERSVTVHPVPNNGKTFTIQTNFTPGTTDQVEILDELGFKVRTIKVETAKTDVTLDDPLTQGVYTLRYLTAGGLQVVRFVSVN